jgi:hypothetical protein
MRGSRADVDGQRMRWAEYRESQKLLRTTQDGFALGGLGACVDEPDIRFMFLAADPRADIVSLDRDSLEWLKTDRASPFNGGAVSWGDQSRVTSTALVRYNQYSDEGGWDRYLAIHRHGGLEFGHANLSREVHGTRIFFLRSIVALVWSALDVQTDGLSRWDMEPPYEMTLAVRRTRGAALGNFAEGWKEPGDFVFGGLRCIEDNVLLRWELDAEFSVEDAAVDAGDRVEQAFGSTHRRHLANRGEYEGRFDPRFAH